jgi:putative two-component system response regulator
MGGIEAGTPTLGDFLAAVTSRDKSESAAALRGIAESARTKLSLSGKAVEPDWFDRVANLLMNSEDYFEAEQRIECLLYCAQWFQKEGKWPLGIAAAEKTVSIAEHTENFALLRRCYSLLGNLHNSTKDYAQATVCYARAVEIARSIGDRVGECAGIANLAAARLHSGLLEESRTLNALVINMAELLEKQDARLTAVKQQAHHNVSLASLMLGDLYIGRKNIEDAIKGPEPENKFEAYQRVIMEYTYVKILSKAAEYETARERAGVARDYATKAMSQPAEMQASLAESACDVNEGNFDVALTRLQKLFEQSRTNEPTRRDVHEALIVSHDKAGNHVVARRMHKEYLTALSQLQRRSARAQLDALKKNFKLPVHTSEPNSSVLPPIVLEKLRHRDREIWQSFRAKLEAMAVLAELRDDSTGEHAFRVGRLSAIFAKALGYGDKQVETIELAARLHDIGKLVVPDLILQKRGKLVDTELEVMRCHTTEGAAILMEVRHEAFRPAAEIALSHHEWWDGNGYPQKSKGEEIPEAARITALVDVFDALSHKRPYKPAWPFDRCIETIRELRGRQFDPRLCDVFLDLIADLHREHHGQLDVYLGAEAERSPIVNANRLIDRIVQEHRSALF